MGSPGRAKGPLWTFPALFWGTWAFGKSKSAATALLTAPVHRRRLFQMTVEASKGYDIPAFANLTTFNRG